MKTSGEKTEDHQIPELAEKKKGPYRILRNRMTLVISGKTVKTQEQCLQNYRAKIISSMKFEPEKLLIIYESRLNTFTVI